MKPLEQRFKEVFGKDAEQQFFASGRVSLIGEHTDYNGGNVFPCAIDRGTYGLMSRRADRTFRMYSESFANFGVIGFTLDGLVNDKRHGWANYPKGVIKMLVEEDFKIDNGFNFLVPGDAPNRAGLSSSASTEVLTNIMLKDLFHLSIDPVTMALLGRKVENLFIGISSGIIDQFAIVTGEKDRTILLDCSTLRHDYVPVMLRDEVVVITNTNKRRGLADSKYNRRRTEYDGTLTELQTRLSIKTLGELSIGESEASKDLIKSPIRQKRTKHAVYENQRTPKARRELSADNLTGFGKLMSQPHISLRNDYKVTGIELDTLATLTWEQPEVVGSRMTDAGFGDCTVNIMKKDKVGDFIESVGEAYKNKIGYAADFYIATVSEGA